MYSGLGKHHYSHEDVYQYAHWLFCMQHAKATHMMGAIGPIYFATSIVHDDTFTNMKMQN